MTAISTSAEIKNLALFNASEKTDGSSDLDSQADIYMNRAYREMYMGGQAFDPEINETWWWMKAEASLILDGNITTGTVSVTKNSATATFSATPTPTVDSTVAGWHLKITGHPDIFKVSSIVTATATLDTVYTGTTAATASYTLFKLDYDLSTSAIKIIGPMTAYQESKHLIYGMSETEMNYNYPLGLVSSGVPSHYSQVDENTIRFNKWGSATAGTIIRVDYDYLRLPTDLADDSVEPLVPKQYRHVLADMITFYLLGDKNSARQEFIGLQARNGLRSMAKENRGRWAQVGKSGHIYPRQTGVGRNLRVTSTGTVL